MGNAGYVNFSTVIFPTVHIGFATISSLLFDSNSSDVLKLAVGRILKLEVKKSTCLTPGVSYFKVVGGRYACRNFSFVAFCLLGFDILAARCI